MLTRRSLLAGSASLLSTKAGAQSILSLNPSFAAPSGIPAFSSVATGPLIGAGGWVTGINFANDGTAYSRCDTYGAFRLDPGATQWVQLVVSSAISLAFPFSDGAYEVATCPGNSSYVCMIVNGGMYYSSNKGVTLSASTGFPTVAGTVNGATTTYYGSARIAFDPANPLNVIAVAPANGAYYSTDGGATWTHIASITTPSGTANGIVVYDPNSTTGGSTPGIYVYSSGNGWYHTTTGPTGTWTLTTGTPTNSTAGACSLDGYLYAVSNSTTVYVYNGSSWSSATAGTAAQSVAPDPGTTGRVVVINQPYGWISVSTNHGTSWSSASTTNSYSGAGSLSVGWIPYIQALTQGSGYTHNSARIAFNPAASNELWTVMGIGIEKCNPSNTPNSSHPTWTDCSSGIENLVVTKIVSPPGIGAIVANWDRPFYRSLSPDVYPSVYFPPASGGNLSEGWSVDWIAGTPNIIVGVAGYPGTESSGISTDGMNTYSVFGSMTPANGGNAAGGSICASSASNIAWVGGGSTPVMYYSTNGGSSWTASTGAPTGGWGPNYYDYPENVMCADRVTPTTFYGYNANGHVYQSTNSGQTWSSVSTPGFTIHAWAQINSVPTQGGHLFFTGQAGSTVTGAAFYFSSNGGTSWSSVSTVTSVNTFGFGAAYPGQPYPTIYIAGSVSGVYGIWRCTNFNSGTASGTWVNLATHPGGNLDYVTAISGDTDLFGWAYIGHTGAGTQKLVSNDAAPWVKPSVPNPGATITRGTPPSWTALAASEIAYSSVSWAVSDGTNTATGTGLTPTIALGGLNAGPGTVAVTTVGNGQTAVVTIPVTLV